MARRRGQDPAEAATQSAQQVWLAGLGAMAKAQQEGARVLESLVRDGLDTQRATAGDDLPAAPRRSSGEPAGRALDPWGSIEALFDERVARALARLGTPTAADMAALQARVAHLEAALTQQEGAHAPPKPSRRKPAPATTSRPTATRRRSAD